mmetsp:Transcript_39266/g.45038  ORF Transcript_39266/g.45038 Transcript_39266/m.45038 type:complete len:127 (-) Transcript_39266:25-405(-)
MLSMQLSEQEYEQLRDALKVIILCERYNKKERISEGLNFTPLRNVLHKYNTRNLSEFISEIPNAYLYTHFYLKNGKQASENQQDVNSVKLNQSMRRLMKEALKHLPKSIGDLFEEIYSSLFNTSKI